MVKITYDPKTYTLKLKGHAGTERICSACSMVYYNLCGVIAKYPKGALKKVDAQEGVNGKRITYLKVKPTKEYVEDVERDFFYALTGFEMLEMNYGDHVSLEIVNDK